MSWHPPRHDTGHDMYLPDKRAKRERLPLYAQQAQSGEVIPDRLGSHEQKQAWVFQRQRQGRRDQQKDLLRKALEFKKTKTDIQEEDLRMAEIERKREAQLLREAESEAKSRHANPQAHPQPASFIPTGIVRRHPNSLIVKLAEQNAGAIQEKWLSLVWPTGVS